MEEQEKVTPDEENPKGFRRETEQDIEDAINLFCGKSDCKGSAGSVHVKINVAATDLDKAFLKLRRIERKAIQLRGLIPNNEAGFTKACAHPSKTMIFDHTSGRITHVDPETTKIRKHTHDTLWAIMLGFAACAGLVIVIGLIIIAVLSYARG